MTYRLVGRRGEGGGQVCASGREAAECVVELKGGPEMHALLVKKMMLIALDKPDSQRFSTLNLDPLNPKPYLFRPEPCT